MVQARGTLVTDQRGPGIDVDGSVLRGRAVVVATGAQPVTLGLAVDGERIITSEQALRMSGLPSSAVVVGGGVIGVEFASMWADLGVEVTLVEAAPSLLPTEEPALSKVLHSALAKRGVTILVSSPTSAARATDEGVHVTLENSEIEAELLLVAAGRRPQLDGIGLDEAGVERSGVHIAVDKDLRTSVRSVYAAGDVVAGPQLAHRGYAHGMFLAEHIAHTQGKHSTRPSLVKDTDIARITYSHPQLASVGLTSQQAATDGEIEVADYPLRGNARALMSRTPGERGQGWSGSSVDPVEKSWVCTPSEMTWRSSSPRAPCWSDGEQHPTTCATSSTPTRPSPRRWQRPTCSSQAVRCTCTPDEG